MVTIPFPEQEADEWNPLAQWALGQRGESYVTATGAPDWATPEWEVAADLPERQIEPYNLHADQSAPSFIEQARAATRTAPEPPAAPRTPREPVQLPAEGVGAITRVTDAEWRRERGLPEKRRRLPPSWTTLGRRERYIEKKAARLGISFAEAERMTPIRPNARRSGKGRVLINYGADK